MKLEDLDKKLDKFITNDFEHLKIEVVKLVAKQKIILSLLFLILGSLLSFMLWAISFFSSL